MPIENYFLFEDGNPLDYIVDNTPVRLRPYQLNAHAAVDKWVADGYRRLLVVMATGVGKTPWLSTLKFKRALFLAHRDKLCEQLYNTVKWAKPDLRVGVEKAEQSASQYDDVVVASVQTMGAEREDRETGIRRITNRLLKWDKNHLDLIVIDEAHHALSPSYLKILKHFGVGEPGGPLLVGVTATPYRGDGEALSNLFDERHGEPTFCYPIEQATQDGWLCDIQYRRIRSSVDISDLDPVGDDLDNEQVAERVDIDDRNSLIISSVDKYARNRKSILVFAVNVKHAERLRDQFIKRGYSAACVHYKIPPNEKEEILNDFSAGKIQVLVNVAILTEGVDIARIDCLVFGRPTRSMTLMSQMLGRGTRQICPRCLSTNFDVLHVLPFLWHCQSCNRDWGGSKAKNCLVLDIVDLCGQLNIRSAMSLFDVRQIDLLGEPIRTALPVIRQAASIGIQVSDEDTIEDVRTRVNRFNDLVSRTKYIDTKAEAIDLFGSIRPTDANEHSHFPWQRLGDDRFMMFCFNGERIGLWRNELGEWWAGKTGNGRKKISVRAKVPWGKVDKQVKRWLGNPIAVSPTYSVPGWKFVTRTAKWRSAPPKPTQIKALERMGVYSLPDKLNRGWAHDLIALIEYNRGKR